MVSGIINLGFFVILLYGLLKIFDINFYTLTNSGLDSLMSEDKISIKKQQQVLLGKKRKNFLKKEVKKLNYILEITDQKKYLPLVFAGACGLSLAGIMLAIFLQNVFLVPVLAIGFFLLPFWVMEDRTTIYKEELNGHIQTALSIITTSYLRTENIIMSIQENIEFIDESLQAYFKEFLVDTTVNPNIELALKKLKNKIDNKFFQEYMDNMIACQTNQMLKSTLSAVVLKMSNLREINIELNSKLTAPKHNFLTINVMLLFGCIAISVVNKEIVSNLFTTGLGKFCLATAIGIVLFSINGVSKVIKPLEE